MTRIIILWFVMLLMCSCNLTTNAPSIPTETPPPTRTATFHDVTQTRTSQDTGSSNSTPALSVSPALSATPLIDDCVPQVAWVEYDVGPGDNLTNIARRTRSTVDELKAANCLDDADANRIRVGQTLYVPNEPID